MEKAKPSKNLYKKIEASLFETKVIPLQTLAIIAASILLLLFINIYTVKNNVNHSIAESSSSDTDQLINDFQIY